MKYVYIDESGETGKSSRYIIFASISTMKHRQLEKAIIKIWRAKPHLHSQGELHANSVDDATRKRVILTLKDLEITIDHRVINKANTKAHSIGFTILSWQDSSLYTKTHT